MNFIVCRINRHAGVGAYYRCSQMTEVTVGRINYPSRVVSVGVVGEVRPMTGSTGTSTIIAASTAVRHGDGLAISRLQDTVSLVAYRASVMNFIVQSIDRHPACCAGGTRMTRCC